MARKYGIVAASDVKVLAPGGTNQANMHSGVVHMPAKRVGVIKSAGPHAVHAGVRDWGSMVKPLGAKLNRGLAQAGQRAGQERQRRQSEDRAAAMPQHPSVRSQGAAASSTGGNPIGALRDHPAVQSANTYYEAPKNMGAKVPASRAAKFNQGRGL